MQEYSKPEITAVGSLHELTLGLNKVGNSHDIYSQITPLIGSIVPSP